VATCWLELLSLDVKGRLAGQYFLSHCCAYILCLLALVIKSSSTKPRSLLILSLNASKQGTGCPQDTNLHYMFSMSIACTLTMPKLINIKLLYTAQHTRIQKHTCFLPHHCSLCHEVRCKVSKDIRVSVLLQNICFLSLILSSYLSSKWV
jgi:hypothetical protein